MFMQDHSSATAFSCDPDVYNQQLEELIVLQSIFGEQISLSGSSEESCLVGKPVSEWRLFSGFLVEWRLFSGFLVDWRLFPGFLVDWRLFPGFLVDWRLFPGFLVDWRLFPGFLVDWRLFPGFLVDWRLFPGFLVDWRLFPGFLVHHLPPIRLVLQFPSTYPVEQPPSIKLLSAMWLTSTQLQSLQSQLLVLWQAQRGDPVVFVWMDWLKQNALSHLGVISNLIVRPTQRSHSRLPSKELLPQDAQPTCSEHETLGAQAASSSGVVYTLGPCEAEVHTPVSHVLPAEELALNLMRYAATCAAEEFNRSYLRCTICFENMLGSSFIQLPSCSHTFCKSCLVMHSQTLVIEGTVDHICCPEPGCKTPVPSHLLREWVQEEAYSRWEGLVLQRALQRMSDVAFCPRCQAVTMKDQDSMGECPSCLYVFCGKCYMAWHPTLPCLSSEELLELNAKRAQTANKSPEDIQRMAIDYINTKKTLEVLREQTKSCPGCSMAIDKFDGCNKVVCSSCSTKFCWRCLKVIEDYSHFSANTCELFDEAVIRRWNNAMHAPRAMEVDDRRYAAMYMIEEGHGRPLSCPMCGQLNAKIGGNNNIRCWACFNNFCGACRMALRVKPGLHFGPSGCKQHS
ncbi:hypothetical protein CEUSTIGMA_g1382.t1 [Chlamydomonas eustigma]|uniref:RBR-type E3 ubiquitin transferase n=1 Tax=Chlamydomonas eustigma TaxID=1157962 RepID=A0A250WTG1_9CHLO|nr:hypothetical protein CEUSTIGMA_g1382.t1 [Chlamydomonas eustigma]|eukprot:GAX73932.1 hypothetical protein CEUSTIGMA_g1382.t1 [Chlamydomonas eustigma]